MGVPFEEIPDERKGYRVFVFQTLERDWKLMTVDRAHDTDGYSSMIVAMTDGVPGWQRHNHLVLDVVISVDDAAAIITRTLMAYERGRSTGSQERAAEIRRALGV